MDYPLPRREPAWKDSLYLKVTVHALAAGLIVAFLVFPSLLWFVSSVGSQLTPGVAYGSVLKAVAQDVTWWVLPYTWISFLAIEKLRVEQHRRYDAPRALKHLS